MIVPIFQLAVAASVAGLIIALLMSRLAARRQERAERQALHVVSSGFALSACAYALRLSDLHRPGELTYASFIFCVAGMAVIYAGWRLYRRARRNTTVIYAKSGRP
ncbi:MAG: hypothetical protein ACLQVD_09140 [Capsulimonadaceae bacterium]